MSELAVFINCPFTQDYNERFWAITYTVLRSGFEPRCSRQIDNAAQVRYSKICDIISDCRLGIHDISFTGLYGDPKIDADLPLPRFNMPFELGLFLGATKFGVKQNREKSALVLDIQPFRYNKFISDISGQDVTAYDGSTESLIMKVLTWLRQISERDDIPGGKVVANEFNEFLKALPAICENRNWEVEDITFLDVRRLFIAWIEAL